MVGRSEMPVRRWTYPKARGGTGGVIPMPVANDLLSAARRRGIDLQPHHFFPEGWRDIKLDGAGQSGCGSEVVARADSVVSQQKRGAA